MLFRLKSATSVCPLILGGYGEKPQYNFRYHYHLGGQGIYAVGAVMPFDAVPDRSAVVAVAKEVPHAVADHYRAVHGNLKTHQWLE